MNNFCSTKNVDLLLNKLIDSNNSQMNQYDIKLYTICVKKSETSELFIYDGKLSFENDLDFIFLKNKFYDYLKNSFTDVSSKFGFIKLEKLLNLLKLFFKTNQLISSKRLNSNINKNIEEKIILFWAYLTGLAKILPFLLDPFVEELFTSPNSELITIDHYHFGRMNTNVLISEKEKENILYRTAMENNKELNQLNPSIRGDIQVQNLFSLRITGDIQPYSIDGIFFNLRKLNQRNFTLEMLLDLQTLDRISCAFFKTLIINGVNFTIIGSPSSGKTTLQNALLRELPPFWRIFSLENTTETSIKSDNFFRFKIFDYLKNDPKKDLSLIFSQLLHRSPDYVNLGEITTNEEAIAWNACMSAGIPVIQTIHSISNTSLINRINKVFLIPIELILSSIPHLVVEVKYFWVDYKKIRKLFSISELIADNNENLLLQTIASYDIEKKRLIWLIEPTNTSTFFWIKKNKNPDISKIYNFYSKMYNEI